GKNRESVAVHEGRCARVRKARNLAFIRRACRCTLIASYARNEDRLTTDALPQPAAASTAHRSSPLYAYLTVLFSLLFRAMGGAIAWVGYSQGRDLTLAATDRVFGYIGKETHASLNQTLVPVGRLADILALQ